MKKIIGILLILALVAGSVFAADVSAKAKINGNFFKFAENKTITLFDLTHGAESWNPELAFSFNGDVAGASFSIYDATSAGDSIQTQKWSIWCKPADILKFTIGNWSTNLNQETIDWSNTETGSTETFGYTASLSTNGFGLDVNLATGWDNPWFTKADADGAEAVIADTYIKAGYGADFGTINAFLQLPETKKMKAGIGYKGTFGAVSAFVNGIIWTNDGEMTHARGELFASTSVSGINLAAFIAGGYNKATGYWDWRIGCGEKGIALGASIKASMSLGAVSPYLYIKSVDFLAEKIALEVKPGITGSVGEMGYEIALDINYNAANADNDSKSAVTVGVPVNFTVNF